MSSTVPPETLVKRNDDTANGRFITSAMETQRNFQLWLTMLTLLTLSRVVHVFALKSYWSAESRMEDFAAAFMRGFRFDCQASTLLISLPLLVGSLVVFSTRLAPVSRFVRTMTAAVFIIVTSIFLIGGIGYYQTHDDRFNAFVFELLRGDTWGTLQIMQTENGALQKLFLALAISGVLWFPVRRWTQAALFSEQTVANALSTRTRRAMLSCTITILYVLGIRSSLHSKPLQQVDMGVTAHRFLNKSVPSNFHCFYYANRDFRKKQQQAEGYNPLSPEQVQAALVTVSGNTSLAGNLSGAGDLGELYHQTAAGLTNPAPEHIFLIIMESYDSWPFMDQYESLHLVDHGRLLASEGLHVRSFLPATGASIDTHLAIISGLYGTSHLSQRKFPTSLPVIMGRLGYRTRLIGGESAMWYQMGDMAKLHGFDEYHSATHVTGLGTRKPRAHDADLFDYVRKQLVHDEPSMTVIRTTSAHGPYDLDLESLGCDIKQLPPDLEKQCTKEREPLLKHYGHLKYSDKCLGRFVKQVEAEFPNSLFVITGDHQGRHFPHGHPNEYERVSVPLILYGKQVLRDRVLPPGVAGSHVDITATLVNMAAPKGFRFESLGKDLMRNDRQFSGISASHLIGPNFIIQCRNSHDWKRLPWAPPEATASLDKKQVNEMFQAYHDLSSWLGQQTERVSLSELNTTIKR